ncbi:MAG TPA: GerMN domain-containing protein [Candidatus Paceibacterota bacterium]|nr:GerMN domain-containing protein [Candidatus Paceibacterota bacterium]
MEGTRGLGWLIVILVVLIAALAGLWYAFSPAIFPDDTAGNASGMDATASPPTYTQVQLALLDTADTTSGPAQGCDRVVMVTRSIPATQAPLTAALRTLFSLSTTTVEGWYNFIAKTNGTLAFDHAAVASGTARIYLTGSLSGLAGVCDDPRAAIQIEQTALQFPTVDRVQLYLNGQPTTLIPSERG